MIFLGLKASFMIATRSLIRRKTKNLSAILAVTLGVSLLVGIQITTDTLGNAFLTGLLQSEGEVDIRVVNATAGGYLKSADQEKIEALVPEAIGIMPELSTRLPMMVASQFDPSVRTAGIRSNFSEVFGSFYDWNSAEKINISKYLIDNSSVLLSSRRAESLGLTKETILPVSLDTEVTNVTLSVSINSTSGLPIITPNYAIESVELNIVGIFDSKRPGIGSQYRGAIFALEHLQDWISLMDPMREKDRVSAYLLAFKTNHFALEIDEDYLQQQVDDLEAAIPERIDPFTGNYFKIYRVESPRLIFFSIAALIMTLMSTMLTALGMLIMVTGVLLITNVQLMSVEDREFQTGVLRAIGENRQGIFRSMLIENMFQGVLGGIFGLLGGLAFGQAVAQYLVSLFGTGELSVQPIVSQQIVLLSVIVGVALGVITGLLPALRASRVNIVEALRGIKVSFKEKSSRNLVLLGILVFICGIYFLLVNGIVDESSQVIWTSQGWDTLGEWRNILLGAGLLFSGVGIILSRFIDRIKALLFTAVALWGTPIILFAIAMGDWVTDITGLAIDILIIGIIEILIGSVLLVALNLPLVMRGLKRLLIRIRVVKGVAQIAPSLISSHRTRSTLTFAIFAVILTLNVVVATMVTTSMSSVFEAEEDSRGIDIIVHLNKPEKVSTGISYTEELTKLDSNIIDVIGFKTFTKTTDFRKFTALEHPYSPEFNPQRDMLPLGYGEIRSDQIRGDAANSSDPVWRYDYYLSSFPDTITKKVDPEATDGELLDMSRRAWDLFFDPAYRMAAYNVSLTLLLGNGIGELNLESLVEFGGSDLEDVNVLRDENGSIIMNPIVFTDSFFLPLGLQLWIPMNTSTYGVPNYQPFTIGGRLDFQRAGGFPLTTFTIGAGEGDVELSEALGKLYLPRHWANKTSFLGEADGALPYSRAENQFDYFLIKTSYLIDDERVEIIAQAIEEFTNTIDQGYRQLVGDNFFVADAMVLYSKIEASLEMADRMVSFLQIYVTFGLVIGSVGMGVISVRNVAERRREIGMMRAIGFPRNQVMLSVLLELVVLGLIGLCIGVVNGLLISVGFANMQNTALIIPWNDISLYLGFITFVALGVGAIPGWLASRIPPAEALRYVG